MTRLNFGVHPRELCDQHVVAEYKELPRAFSFGDRTIPGPFRLGRPRALVRAVPRDPGRPFSPAFREPRGDGVRATEAQLAAARLLVTKRIRDRLASMTRVPRWTNRSPPDWV